jgi:diaminopimelate dehydrogenase
MVLCGGSASDLPEQTPEVAALFCFVDSFDTHARIPEHFANVDCAAKKGKTVGVISAGWDPGLFSLQRLYGQSVLPNGNEYTFWGPGVSQGHSDAIRRICGVADAKQYTIPKADAMDAVRCGTNPQLSTRQKHIRVCYVVADNGANEDEIRSEIVNMPNYFADYDTTVNFISSEEFKENHSGIPHGGFVFRTGSTSDGINHVVEYSLKLESNPEFTSSILTAYARAAYRLHGEGVIGAKTVLDVAPSYLSPKSNAELYKELL